MQLDEYFNGDEKPPVVMVNVEGVLYVGEPEQVGENYYIHFPLQYVWNFMVGQPVLSPFPLEGDTASKLFVFGDSIAAVSPVSKECSKVYYSMKTGLAIPGGMKWDMPQPPGPGSKPPPRRP